MIEEPDDDVPAVRCPYCHASIDCEHYLLFADVTFRRVEGGLLGDAFNERWDELSDSATEDTDDSDVFHDILDEVAELSDCVVEYDFDGAPGMSSVNRVYFAESAEKAQAVLFQFQSRG